MKTDEFVKLSELSFFVLKEEVVTQLIRPLINRVDNVWIDSEYVKQSQLDNDCDEFKKYLRSILNGYKERKLETYNDLDSSGYIEEVFYPTDNKYVDCDRLIEILGPKYLIWKSKKTLDI
jgi:hypothetical protein